ncbi:amino acid ABC transporter substrate-binding protein [Paracoccus laeviglucosivorans]|uniref:L-glutamine-binding protein /L-glutamate-binding protein /L-aspartate-binding protein /L-asparagine-binding protein n=1 Tax=Paracoccus laeviglucosivorans TaxID=1197861 RepID=A0A521DBB1_9RHOB|nr:amino acid ABC transporter substrate-binding protein [Paracoccus laeviglucosivorans]SMO68170.1 L-glutamine-binding protein /L-glutamate-binding protein /L-aspartate-binding protein /L-asparagine-binding protein [Paracoccus laeviglucosivorans]
MKKSALFGSVTVIALAATGAMAAEGDTLKEVKARGVLNCGVNTGLVGFAAPDANGNWSGFDVSFCKAVAAAVLGDATKVKYVPTTGQTRFTALSSGEVDLLARNSTWTFQRDTDLKLDFIGVNYYDGQGFMVRKDLGVSSAKELDGATICIQTGTTTELNLADYFKANNMTYQPVNIDSNAEGEQQYMAGACDAYTTDASGLAATRASFADPENHIILPEIISKEPLGPAVRHGDNNWGDITRWTLYALIAAEEYGVTSANIEELSKSSTNPEVQRLLGATDNLGGMIGLDAAWAKNAIKAGGNYGEIFAATIGEQTPIGLARGLNAQWTQGGLMYAMPFR